MGFRNVTLGLRSLRSREWGFAIPSGKETFWFWSLKLAQVGTIFAFFRICSAFFGFPHSSWLFPSICFHFCRFFFDFSSIWGRFWEVFSMIFDTFLETHLNAFLPERFSSDVLPPKVLSYSFEIVFSFSSLCEAVMISSAVLFTAASCLLAKILTCILLMPYVCISFIFICIYVHFSM